MTKESDSQYWTLYFASSGIYRSKTSLSVMELKKPTHGRGTGQGLDVGAKTVPAGKFDGPSPQGIRTHEERRQNTTDTPITIAGQVVAHHNGTFSMDLANRVS